MVRAEPLVLPGELLLIPLEALPATVRDEVEHDPDDWAIIRPDVDARSDIVNAATAELLKEFRVPQTVDDALQRFCRRQNVEPDEMREEALPLLQELESAGLLVPADAEEERARSTTGAAQRLLAQVLERLGATGTLLTGRIAGALDVATEHGAADIAFFRQRVGSLRNDPVLLALAKGWIAKEAGDGKGTLVSRGTETAIAISPYDTLSNAHCLRALISHALGNGAAKRRAIGAFLAAAQTIPDALDLTVGQTATLMGCIHLLDLAISDASSAQRALRELGNRTVGAIWQQLDSFGPIAECSELSSLGIAHGWAGVLYGTLRWSESTGFHIPGRLEERLEQLSGCAEYVGRGMRWEWRSSGLRRGLLTWIPGWCNGSAGFVHLWTLAYRELHRQSYLDIAEKAAWNAWEERWTVGTLCCGLAGQAYALLNLYNCTREDAWLERTRVLADLAAVRVEVATDEQSQFSSIDGIVPNSLYRGEIGVALLAAELDRPDHARMPFFERNVTAFTRRQ